MRTLPLFESLWMQQFREKAKKQFLQLPDPQWKYGIQIQTAAPTEYDTALTPEPVTLRHNVPDGVVFCDLMTAIRTHPEIVAKYLMTVVTPDTKELAYHAAYITRGVFLYVPPNTSVLTPLTAAYPGSTTQIDHTLIIVGENSAVTFIEETEADMPFRSHVIEVVALPNARVTVGEVQRMQGTKQLSMKKAIVAKDASVQWLDCCLGSSFTKGTIASHLQGEGATAKTWSVFTATTNQYVDMHVCSIHESEHTSSDIVSKGVVDDNATVVYRGLVKIKQQAHHSKGYQKEDVLLLSPNAEADVVPDLQIDTNDVHCSHGATVGQIDQERLFYMMSRGLSYDQAKIGIIQGFFAPMLEAIDDSALANHIQDIIHRHLLPGLDTEGIRKHFPILQRTIHGKPLVYLDNAATTQKPRCVIDALTHYYTHTNANVHRGIHTLSEESTNEYEYARQVIGRFIGARSDEVIFTKNATEALNMAASTLGKSLFAGDEIIITVMDHHSNIVPWQTVAKDKGCTLHYVTITGDGTLDLGHFNRLLSARTKVVSLPHASNVLGTINPIEYMAKKAHEFGAYVVVDGAQAAPHMPVDVKLLGVDMYAFSGHKMCGPTGVGVLYCKKELLATLPTFLTGGGTISDVSFQGTSFVDGPERYEAGTPNIASVIGLARAIEYLKGFGMEKIYAHELELSRYAIDRLRALPGLRIYGPVRQDIPRLGVLSFEIPGIHAHDMAQILDGEGIAVRAGHHCAKPLMSWLHTTGTTRASLYLYNTKADIDKLIAGIIKAREVFAC